MLSVLTDENFDARILHGLRRRLAILDAVRVQDVGPLGVEDPEILAWAAAQGRVLLTRGRKPSLPHPAVDGLLREPSHRFAYAAES